MKLKIIMKSPTKLLGISLLFTAYLFSLSGCQSSPANVDQLREVCFESEILPILQNSCATSNCHDSRGAEGFRLDSYEGIMRGIEPGNPQKSTIYRAIISTGFNRMPPATPLSEQSRTLIRIWIEQGSAKTVCDSGFNIIDTVNPVIPPQAYSNPLACFERDILPLMNSSCGVTGCHDPVTRKEGLNLTSYQGILKGVKPGNPGSSKIYNSITKNGSDDDVMPPPPYSRLSSAQKDTIYNWILRGALDEDCGDLCDTLDITYTTHLAGIIASSCTGCHSGTNPQGGVRVDSYNNLVALVNSGAVPAVLRGTNGHLQMPPVNPLSECSVREFEIWIDNGIPE